ncbi:hypothetical protein [Clostridium sp.]|uniref:hypothetical protein n=1 Tax=Clostridium sp. TaxID=1506 RepID=UPI002914A9B5|nr:hypothetical protein [Clostridium sp.]MDU3524245.1 hypothetical protein [Clostridium sp.]MDU3546274.1 hypothetical protein [Clostridium sp.]MDU6363283.1 hypothetical protein [Clostridium sp.]
MKKNANKSKINTIATDSILVEMERFNGATVSVQQYVIWIDYDGHCLHIDGTNIKY